MAALNPPFPGVQVEVPDAMLDRYLEMGYTKVQDKDEQSKPVARKRAAKKPE